MNHKQPKGQPIDLDFELFIPSTDDLAAETNLGAETDLVSCSVCETVVPAGTRRPALRITFVMPGEESPLSK